MKITERDKRSKDERIFDSRQKKRHARMASFIINQSQYDIVRNKRIEQITVLDFIALNRVRILGIWAYGK